MSPKTIDARLRHAWSLLDQIGNTPLNKVTTDDISRFKSRLREAEQENTGSGSHPGHHLAPKTVVQICHDLRIFYDWLARQPGYRSMRPDLSAYFTPERKLVALAHAKSEKRAPSAEDIRQLLASMPLDTWRQRRDRAIIAFLFLTGVRIDALISLRLKHVDLDRRLVVQDAREVRTKFSKTMRTTWFPVGDDIAKIVTDWVKEQRLKAPSSDAPLFCATPSAFPQARQNTAETFWTTPAPVRKILKQATAQAGMDYFNPHAIRSTLAVLFYDMAGSLEDVKALSQNLGHEDIRTTFEHYGTLTQDRQQACIQALWEQTSNDNEEDEELFSILRSKTPEQRKAIKAFLSST